MTLAFIIIYIFYLIFNENIHGKQYIIIKEPNILNTSSDDESVNSSNIHRFPTSLKFPYESSNERSVISNKSKAISRSLSKKKVFSTQRNYNKRECTTNGGPSPNKKCIFPFKFEVYLETTDTIKDTHDTCILDDDGFWCSTKVDEHGYHFAGTDNWGTCSPDCPLPSTNNGGDNLGASRDFKGNGTVSSPKTCCSDKKVPTKCLGMCTKRRTDARALTNVGTCKTYWESIKTCVAQGEEHPGQLSPYDFAIDCCESKGIPRLCLGSCVPGGATPKGRKRIKCSKHGNEMYECKKAASRMLNTDGQTQATTSEPHKITSSNSVTLTPIQNSSDITTQEISLSSTTSLGPVSKTEQCCIDFGVAYECLGLCYDLDISDDESNEYYFDIGSCETYAEFIKFCQNP